MRDFNATDFQDKWRFTFTIRIILTDYSEQEVILLELGNFVMNLNYPWRNCQLSDLK